MLFTSRTQGALLTSSSFIYTSRAFNIQAKNTIKKNYMRSKLKARIDIIKKAMGPPAHAVYFFVFCKFCQGLMK